MIRILLGYSPSLEKKNKTHVWRFTRPNKVATFRSENQVAIYVLIDPLVVFHQPTWKICERQIGSSPRVSGWNFQIFELPPPRYSSNNSTLTCAWKSMPRGSCIIAPRCSAVFRSPRHWSILRELASLGNFVLWKCSLGAWSCRPWKPWRVYINSYMCKSRQGGPLRSL